jgi:putative nucleotidyltransferase with HDIG domain
MITQQTKMSGALSSGIYALESKLENIRASLESLPRQFPGRNDLLEHLFLLNDSFYADRKPQELYCAVTRLLQGLFRADACVLRLVDSDSGSLDVAANFHTGGDVPAGISGIRLGDGVSGKAAVLAQPMAVGDIDKDSGLKRIKLVRSIRRAGYRALLAVPVRFRRQILGVITVYRKQPYVFTDEQIKTTDIFAAYTAMVVQEARHFRQISGNCFDTINALVLSLENRDPYSHGHTQRVTRYAEALGDALCLPARDMTVLRYAAEVHDIGKISIPDFILNKPSGLTKAERVVIEMHPVKSAEILQPLGFMHEVLPIVKHHHERFDGTGYPDRLEGEHIPYLSRILACADSFDAMVSDRPYRPASLTVRQAVREIKRNSGTQFDPDIARSFCRIVRQL